MMFILKMTTMETGKNQSDEYVIYKWEKMKKYVAIYLISRWHKSPYDILYCSNCYKVSNEVHHLLWRIWEIDWIPLLYHPKYLASLCRKCHTKAEMNQIDVDKLIKREENKIKIYQNDYDEYFTQ